VSATQKQCLRAGGGNFVACDSELVCNTATCRPHKPTLSDRPQVTALLTVGLSDLTYRFLAGPSLLWSPAQISLSGADTQQPCKSLHSAAQTYSDPVEDFIQWRRHIAALHKTSLSGADTQQPCTKLHSVAHTHSGPAQNFTQWRRHRAALHKTSLSGADTEQPCTKLHSVAQTHIDPAQTPLSGANTQLSVSTGMKPTAKGAVPTTVPPGDVTLGQ